MTHIINQILGVYVDKIRKTGEMLLPSIAYGDAAGLPVETKSFTYIDETHGTIDQLISPKDNIYFRGEWPAGTTSDDTQLSVAVANALIRANRFDLTTVADEHVIAYDETPQYTLKNGNIKKLGWGSSTAGSIERIKSGVSPHKSGSKEGVGNGILMKMAPLAYWQYAQSLSDAERYRQFDELTSMTHDNDVARVATRVHGDVLYSLMLEEFDVNTFGYKAWQIARFHEKSLGVDNHDVSDSLDFVRGFYKPSVPEIQARYQEKSLGVSDKEFGKSYGFYVPETLALSYAAFCLGHGDYKETVYGAVNLGGDADSTASIAGTLVNFMRGGEQEMPSDIDQVQDIDRLRTLSHELSIRALS